MLPEPLDSPAPATYRIEPNAIGWFVLKETSTGSILRSDRDREKLVNWARAMGIRLLNS